MEIVSSTGDRDSPTTDDTDPYRNLMPLLQLNNLLTEGFDVLKLVKSLVCFKHHFGGAISWFVDEDPEDWVIFFGQFPIICIFYIVLLFWVSCWGAQPFFDFLIPCTLSLVT